MNWHIEETYLRGDILFIITYNDEGRGSIHTRSKEEADECRKALETLKKPQSSSGATS